MIRPRTAALVGLAWAVVSLALHLAGGRDHVAVLAGAGGSPLHAALGLATVITHVAGVLVVGPGIVAAGLGALADRLLRRTNRATAQPQARSSQSPQTHASAGYQWPDP